jgi:hypothetical protein
MPITVRCYLAGTVTASGGVTSSISTGTGSFNVYLFDWASTSGAFSAVNLPTLTGGLT